MTTTSAYTVRPNDHTPNGPGWSALDANGDGWLYAAAGGLWSIRRNDLATVRQLSGTADTGAWTLRAVRAHVAGRR